MRIFWGVLSVIWMGIIFYFSSLPSIKITEGILDTIIKHLAHFGEYFILYFLYFKTFLNHKTSLILSSLYAISDELHQAFIPSRRPSLIDILIDILGALSCYYLIKFRWSKL
ncbi:MAG: VanZ family protein [bacterium]|nr:VanZ family protein [bacterium]